MYTFTNGTNLMLNPYLGIAISGGGALGIGPAHFLSNLEIDLGFSISSKATAFAGTSTGSIIASLLADGWSGNNIYDMYSSNISKIFDKYSYFKRILNPKSPKYDNSQLKEILKNNLHGNMSDYKKIICIPTTQTNGKNVEKVWDNDDESCSKWFAVLSSCSAPTYFTPAGDSKNYIDGGMWANDPIEVLDSELCKVGFKNKFRILSFNTGMKVPNDDKGDKNLLGWGKYILNDWVARTGNGELFKAQQHLGKENICRLEPIIKKSYEMDDLTVLDTVTEIWNDYYKTVKNDVIKFILNK